MYESPIIEIMTQMEAKFIEERNKVRENQMMLEIKEAIGYEIDKEELLKVLQYDRDQYDKGYIDGYDDAKRTFSPKKEPGYHYRLIVMLMGILCGMNGPVRFVRKHIKAKQTRYPIFVAIADQI